MIKVFELRIGYECPSCSQKMWVGNFDGTLEGMQRCVRCGEYIYYGVEIEPIPVEEADIV
jgi:hypothetical protein